MERGVSDGSGAIGQRARLRTRRRYGPTVTQEQIEKIESERRRQAECDRRLALESASESLLRRTLRGCFSPVRSAPRCDRRVVKGVRPTRAERGTQPRRGPVHGHLHRPDDSHGKTSVLLLDNTGHAEGTRPRGGSSKLDLCQLAYEVRGGQSCSRDKHGSIRLKRTRHRDGDELRELEVGFGGGRYTSIRVPEGGDLAKVKEAIGAEPRTKNEAYDATKAAGIKMRKQDFLRQIDAWAAEPGSGLDVVDGKVSVS